MTKDGMHTKAGCDGRKWFLTALLFLVLPLVLPGQAGAWWNEQWQYRKKITFDTTPTGADIKENLTEVPVLLRLHTGNFSFPNAKEDGTDIRFISADDLTPLKHHIEKFDPLDEMGLVWVKLSRLSGRSNLDFIWMYYGNPNAMGGQDAGGTYDINAVGAFHLAETEGVPRDATAFGNHATHFAGGQGLPSAIGNGITLNGAGEKIVLAASPSLDFTGGFSFSTWIRISQPQEDAYLFARMEPVQVADKKEKKEGEEEPGFRSLVIGIDQTKVYGRITYGGEEKPLETEKIADLVPQNWHYLAVTVEPRGRMAIYLDGIEMTWVELPGGLPALTGDMAVGGTLEGEHSFIGEIDEIRLANAARSGDWVGAAYRSQGPEALLCAYGVEEIGESGGFLPTFYLATVVKNVTLDGWVIIGLLTLFAGVSWLVFFSKTLTLMLVQKDNRAFLAVFEGLKDLSALDREDQTQTYTNSSIFRIYHAGCVGLKALGGNPHPADPGKGLSPRAMNALRTALEKAFVRETQRLNAWLVVLTMAIAGGPFLGLLGTVWGVMNTFAAMAEAGEANIMAIAPGMASALATTVFGLIVAIPALFAYNYLASRVKDVTADMGVFVDEFAARAEAMQGDAA